MMPAPMTPRSERADGCRRVGGAACEGEGGCFLGLSDGDDGVSRADLHVLRRAVGRDSSAHHSIVTRWFAWLVDGTPTLLWLCWSARGIAPGAAETHTHRAPETAPLRTRACQQAACSNGPRRWALERRTVAVAPRHLVMPMAHGVLARAAPVTRRNQESAEKRSACTPPL